MRQTDRDEHRVRLEALRDRLWGGRQAIYESVDKAILTLSSGALALSLVFLKDIVPLAETRWLLSLLISWGFFVGAIMAVLVSFIFGQKAHDAELKALDEYLDSEIHEYRSVAHGRHSGKWSLCTEWSNWVALGFFLAGMIATVLFVGVNVWSAKQMIREEKVPARADREDKGLPPPRVPPPPPPPKQPDKKAGQAGQGAGGRINSRPR